MELATIGKAKILHQHVFRNSNPAVFGVEVVAGKLKAAMFLMDETGKNIGRIKGLQLEGKTVTEALEGMQVAISIGGMNFDRVLGDKQFLYSDLSEVQFKTFKKNKDLLNLGEIKALQEIGDIKGF